MSFGERQPFIENAELIKRSWTSGLAIFELISGMTGENFVKRQNILAKIVGSDLIIDWRFPLEVFADAFPAVDLEKLFASDLFTIAKFAINAVRQKTHPKFESRRNGKPVMYFDKKLRHGMKELSKSIWPQISARFSPRRIPASAANMNVTY